MEWWMIVTVIVIVLAASFLQASTGFGFSIMATPFLLLLFEPYRAIQINIILSILLSAIMVPRIYKDVDRALFGRLLIGSIGGLPLGILIYVLMDVYWLKVFISIMILIITTLLVLKFTMRQTKSRDIAAGVVSGMLTTAIGMPGPPLLIYFSGIGTGKATLRSTILAYYALIYVASLAMQIVVSGESDASTWMVSAYSIPVVLLGTVLGQLFFKKLNQTMFQRIAYALLFFTGGYLLITSFI